MTSETLSNIEKELRQAAEGHRYEDVRRLAADFCQTAAQHLKSLPPGDPRIAQTTGKVREVLDWSLLMVQASRAALADELKRVRTLDRYLRRDSGTASLPHLRLSA
jgi:hypothetical protein